MMTCMRARRSSKFGHIRLLTAELAALERLKNPHRLVMGKWRCHLFSAVLDQILFILAGNDDIHKSLDDFEIRPDPIRNHRVALEHLKINVAPILVSQLWLYMGNSQVSVYKSIGPLV